MSLLSKFDPEIAKIINKEIDRQRQGLEMIASENFVSRVVLEATGTPLTNKYSEGYPGKRYYGGNQFIDESESLAIERAEKLFNVHEEECPKERIMKANVQPHSGSQANMAAYMALAEPGDKIMALDLAHGGHLTHGSPVNFSGQLFNFVHYQVEKETGRLNMDKIRKQAKIEKPKIILCGYTAYPREIDFKAFREIADEVGAYLMADIAHIAGLVATGVHADCVPYADVITTTTHKTLRGPRGAIILSKVEDRINPNDKKNLAEKVDFAVFPGMQGGPLDHIINAKAVAFAEALRPEFKEYCQQIVANAKALAESLMENGINLVSDGTDNHLVLADLTKTGVTGKEAQNALEEVDIYVNKNMVPFDARKPMNPSGIRIGTPALTTRGFKEDELKEIGKMIAEVIHNIKDGGKKDEVRKRVKEMAEAHPLYEGLEI